MNWERYFYVVYTFWNNGSFWTWYTTFTREDWMFIQLQYILKSLEKDNLQNITVLNIMELNKKDFEDFTNKELKQII